MDVRAVILCLSILVAAGEPTKRLTVRRGCKVDLRPALASPRNCSIRYIAVPGLSCGSVSPSEFSCDYMGTVEYHHYGCFANYELVHFQRSALPSNDSETATVELFSVEIHVEDFQSPVVNISVRLFKAQPSGYLIRLIFPASSVGACQYEISSGDPLVPFPLSGKLDGTVNQPLPCGFLAPLQLSNVSHIVDRDHLLVRVRVFSDNLLDVVNIMLPLEFTEVSGSIPKRLSTKHLTVAQVTVTPIYPNLLPNYAEIPHKYIFPVHSAGTFCPVHSPCTDVPNTVFTTADLSAGLVAFIPNEGYVNSPVTYNYSVTDFAGSLLALGRVRVYVAIRDWSRSSQRTNNGLTVIQGTSTLLDSSSLDFYVLPKCRLISHLSLLQAPQHGNFTYLNGSWPDTATVPYGSVKNGTIQYTHSGDGSIADRAVWELTCTLGVPLVVFLSIRIAPLEAVFPPLPYSLSVTAYQHLAMPLTLQAQTLPPNVQLRFDGYNGTLVRVKNLEALLSKRDAFFPYVKVSTIRQVTQSAVQECSLSEVHKQTIWYIPRQTLNNSDVLEFTVNDMPRRHYLTVSISLDPLSDDLMLSTASDYPELLYNFPLPLHANSNVFITARQLYTSALASPANSILYVVRVDPKHGWLCLLSPHKCNSSVQQFTQREINLQRLFYMPTQDTDRNDSFHFVVTINGVRSYHEIQHQFQITATAPMIAVGKQFWINVGKQKRVAAKYLRPYTKPFSTKNNKDLVFRVTSGPAYGELVVNKTGSFLPYPNFTFGDAVDQKVWYYHGAGWGTHCSDLILFTVTDGEQEVNGSLLIAVKQSLDIYLGAKTTPRSLFGQTTFILSSDDLSAISPFCPEFVTYTIDSEPTKGVITLYNARHKTVQQLRIRGTFTEADIKSGFVRYSINDPTNLTYNSSDGFDFNLSDPRTSNHMDLPLRAAGQPVRHFSVLIWKSSDEIYNVSIDIASPQPLTWLPEYSVYGYIFSTDAIRVHSDDIRSNDVVIIVTQRPWSGTFKRNSTEVVHFTLDEVQAGLVWFESTLRNFHRNFNDMFLFSILIESLKVHVLLNQVFSLEWSTVQLEESRYFTQETAGSVEITIRRDGPNWFESRVLLTTQPNNATPATNCSSPGADTDYCSLLVEVVFPPGETRATQNVSIIDDSIAEGPESLILSLLNPNSTIIREEYNTATVIITDESDYSLIGFSGSRPQFDPRSCQLEVTAQEQGGTLAINLTRSGNVEKPVGVICYTQPDTADHGDFVPRTNSHESVVVFGPNETVAQCLVEIVDDDMNEINEKFVVRLGETVGLARVDHSSTLLCVFIVYDEHDAPVVSFNTSEIIVQESENGDIHAAFEICREGSDLAFPTTVTYSTVTLVADTAEPQVDYSLFSSGRCGVETECVTFQGGQMSLLRSVTILHDRVKESNETFHVHIREVQNGKKGERQLLRITIIDGTKPAKVSFVAPEFQFEETHAVVQVRFQRLCYTAGKTSVSCILKWGTATRDDFYIPDYPEVVVVPAGETDGVCNVYILDDSFREGPETFTVRLDSSEVGVVFTNTSVATVVIKDPEDVPVVGFSPRLYEVQEPLSNFPPDVTHVLLTVTRTGDLSRPSTVTFSTEEVTATAGEDFLPTSGRITFQINETLANFTVQVLANHASELNRQFYVEITANTTPHHEVNTDPQRYRALINVTNQPVKGVYFPELPILASLHHNDIFSTTHLFHDLPLLCITPCDGDYSTVVGNADYSSECERQQIDPTLTEYTWELSTDGTHFSKLQLETAFTSTEDKVLESLYLQRGLYVQCTAWAVDSFGRKCYNRTSEALLLTATYASHCDSYNAEGITVSLSSYPDFTAANEDLLHLSVTLPHIPNAIPLVSTYPMENETHPPAQSCVDPGNSLLQLVETLRKPQSLQLYNHLNILTCQWTFETWLPLMTLIDNCSANMTNSSTICVPIYTAYVHILMDNTISTVHTHTTNASLHVDSGASPLTVPVITYPSTGDPNSYIYPIAAASQYNASNLQLYIYSTALFSGEFTAPHGSSTTLLYSMMTEEGRRQAWIVEVQDTATVSVELDPCFSEGSAQTCIRRLPSYIFTLHLSFTPLSLIALTLGTLKHNLDSPANMSAYGTREPFAYGDTVYGMVSLDATQHLRTDFSLVITRVLLCSSASGRTPVYNQLMHCNTSILDVIADVSNSTFDASFLSPTVFRFKTDPLYQDYSSPWYVHIIHDVRSKGHPGAAEQHIILPLLLQPMDENATLTSSSSTGDLIPLIYTAIAIAISALSLVLLVCSVSAVVYWMWQAKQRKQLLPPQEELKNSEKPVYNIMSGSVEPRFYDLRRTTSTTGFPTAEHYRRPTHKKTHQQTLTQSRSLPNLSLLASQQPRARIIPERRRILRTPLTTIKVLNTALPNHKHGLRAYKPVIKVIQNDLGKRQLGRRHTNGTELASYAVRSLATSAMTPEPGSKPITEL